MGECFSPSPALEYPVFFIKNPAKVHWLILGNGAAIADGLNRHGIYNAVFELIVDICKKSTIEPIL